MSYPAQGELNCCGYICHQGVPGPWECPGCHRVQVPPGWEPPKAPAPIEAK